MNDAPHGTALGAAVLARRTQLRMTRADVQTAGGPSPATLQRIEGGDTTTLKAATKSALEAVLKLPDGWIDTTLDTGAPPELPDAGRVETLHEGGDERVLVAIVNGVARLSDADRIAVLALVRAMQERDTNT